MLRWHPSPSSVARTWPRCSTGLLSGSWGLIGLGGAEFRRPVLAGIFGYAARHAVALNLAIGLLTVLRALLIRGGTLSLAPVLELLPVALAMMAGAVSAAFLALQQASK